MGDLKYYALLPVFNKNILTKIPDQWKLTDDILIRKLEKAEQRLLAENDILVYPKDEICDYVVQIILKSDYGNIQIEKVNADVRLDALNLQTILNLVSNNGSVTLPYGIVVERKKISKIVSLIDFELDYFAMALQDYSILPTISLSETQKLITSSRRIIKSDTTVRITFRRFCTTFMKTNWEDKLVDLTIALESLIPTEHEISFQFKLYLSLIRGGSLVEREKNYKLLGDLYSARSGIVHGTSTGSKVEKAIAKSKENWDELLSIAKYCILYRLDFKDRYPSHDWGEHLKSLAIGNK